MPDTSSHEAHQEKEDELRRLVHRAVPGAADALIGILLTRAGLPVWTPAELTETATLRRLEC